MSEDCHCDVAVSGGGVSGAIAAVASARGGARTVLLESRGALGGTGVRALLRHICGLYAQGGDGPPSGTLNGGIVSEVVKGLKKLHPGSAPERMGMLYVLPYRGFDLQHVFHSLCRAEPLLEVLLGASVVSVSTDGGRIREVRAYRAGLTRRIFPKVVVDCTGGGDVASMAGAPFELSPEGEIQLAGYCIRLRGISGQEDTLPIKVPYHLAEAVRGGMLPASFRFTHYSAGDSPDEGYCKFGIEGSAGAGAEADVLEAVRHLARSLPSLRDCYIAETSGGAVQREGRRIKGQYTLTEEDVLGAVKFPDGVVRGSWPIEIWKRDERPSYKYVRSGDYYEIPFRCLRAVGVENLLCAGRCISVTHEALGSTRVMGTCMALGEQAGRAAAGMAASGEYPVFDK
jgi:hypothetical protein